MHPDGRLGEESLEVFESLSTVDEHLHVVRTREDRAVNSWYRANNFKAEQHYLHVYKAWNEDLDAKPTPTPKLRIVGASMSAADTSASSIE